MKFFSNNNNIVHYKPLVNSSDDRLKENEIIIENACGTLSKLRIQRSSSTGAMSGDGSGRLNAVLGCKGTYYTILYYTILCYTILYYNILYYIILYYTILYYTILYYICRPVRAGKASPRQSQLLLVMTTYNYFEHV